MDHSALPLIGILVAWLGFYLSILFIGMLIFLAIDVFICWVVYTCYQRIPEKHRTMSPGQVWLALIPCFGLIWNFWVFPGLSKSYKSYFDSVGDTSVGDCYAQVALWLCISVLGCYVPAVQSLAALASIVLLIIFLVKAVELKNKIKI